MNGKDDHLVLSKCKGCKAVYMGDVDGHKCPKPQMGFTVNDVTSGLRRNKPIMVGGPTREDRRMVDA